MAAVTTTVMTQLEVAKRTKDNNVIAIAEVLDEMNEVLGRAPMVEANLVHSHRLNKRGHRPAAGLRGPNGNMNQALSRVDPVVESMSVFDEVIEIDELNLKGIDNAEALKETEVYDRVEAVSEGFHEQLVYGNPGDDPLEQNGIETRFYVSTQANVAKKSGTGNDLCSLIIIAWGLNKVHLIYPKGMPSGIYTKNWGDNLVTDSSGKRVMWQYQVMIEFGLAIHDDRAVQRIANIESTGTSNNLIASNGMHDLVYAKNRLPKTGKGENAVMYVNRDLKSQFDIFALDKDNAYFTVQTLENYDTITRFQGIRIDMLEQLLSTESAIS